MPHVRLPLSRTCVAPTTSRRSDPSLSMAYKSKSIKKRVAWFCGSWKKANASWASGESDVDLMDKPLKLMKKSTKKMVHLCLSIVGIFFERNRSGMPIWNTLQIWIQKIESFTLMMMWWSISL